MYPVKVDRKTVLHIREGARNPGTVAAVTIDGVRHACEGEPQVLDPQRLRGTLLRVEAAERIAAQAAFDARFESFTEQFEDAVIEVKAAANGQPCGAEMEELLYAAAGAFDGRFATESVAE